MTGPSLASVVVAGLGILGFQLGAHRRKMEAPILGQSYAPTASSDMIHGKIAGVENAIRYLIQILHGSSFVPISCRGWYHTGRLQFLENATTVYFTPPYVYSGNTGSVAQSATGALVDPVTSAHVGQTLVDFTPKLVFSAFSPENTPLKEYGYPVLITPTALDPVTGGDTVIGPGLVRDAAPPPIEDLVVKSESRNCTTDCQGREHFIAIVDKMKRGDKGSTTFAKEGSDRSLQEMFIAYAPVFVKSMSPKNSSSFSIGVHSEDLLIYSVAFVANIEGLLEPFEAIAGDMENQRNVALLVLSAVIVLSSVLVVYISNRVAVSITKPMLYLVELIQHINR
jgi:hypothetical protein